ncbi:hypothetical protein [Clostera anachoreta granulovirus]|uniref:Ac76 n=1 Tax=Clostera anachoreta granulovirus TaxID=283675 RepID=F4ZKW9_9BBAC|nr:hypothetical protein ClanGV_gp092 [Clostera anachoreta granulovirus]AEB00380.1 hypothetical protein [Clostera anachoreta granulovirus]
MWIVTLIVSLVLFAFIFNKFGGSELLLTILVLLVLFFCVLNVYYNNTESAPHDLYNEDVKKMKKKQQLNDTFDALLNKNTSSSE